MAEKHISKKELIKLVVTRVMIVVVCFLIAFGFTFSFGSYFSERFFQLYNGIKEISSNNYGQRLYFDGKDEFYEISLVFNEMVEKLEKNKQELSVTLQKDRGKEYGSNDIQELKKALIRIKIIEEQTEKLISRLENN